ncbi:MAG: DNA-binding response regulator, partial [Verrucomicrobiota bacterium]|nr:DNA-binding response regulator [Verrucomicrobiota bacterium]
MQSRVATSKAHGEKTALTSAPPKRHRIIVVDDHPLFRKGVVQMLSQEPDLEVRAEAESSPAALDLIRRTPVDLAI